MGGDGFITRFWWVRHAPIAAAGRMIGHTDLEADLSDTARIAALRDLLPAEARWLITPLRRSAQTAAALRAADSPPPAVEPAFIEQNFGAWDGQSYAEIFAGSGDSEAGWRAPARLRPPGGESFEEVCRRVTAGIARWRSEIGAGDIVVIAHAGSIRAALAQALNLDPAAALQRPIGHLSLSRIDWQGGAASVVHENLMPDGSAGI